MNFKKIQYLGLSLLLTSALNSCDASTATTNEAPTPSETSEAQKNTSIKESPAKASPTPTPEVSEKPSSSSSETPSAPKVIDLDLSEIPSQIKLSVDPVSLRAYSIFDNDKKVQDVYFSIPTDSILKKQGGFVVPVKTGKVKVTFTSSKNTSVKKTVEIEVVTQLDTSAGGTEIQSSVASASNSTFAPYFLSHYKVGMKWIYRVDLVSVELMTPFGKPYPENLTLGWGLSMTGVTEGNKLDKVREALKKEYNLATYTIEVLGVQPGEVTLKTEVDSNSSGIPSVLAEIKAYTKDTIGEIYTGIIQTVPASKTLFKYEKSNDERFTYYTTPYLKYLGDKFKSISTASDGIHTSEEGTVWLNHEIGMVYKEVHLKGLRADGLSVDTGIVIKLIGYEDF